MPGAAAKANHIIQPLGGGVDAIIMGGYLQIDMRTLAPEGWQQREQHTRGESADYADLELLLRLVTGETVEHPGNPFNRLIEYR